MGTFWKCVLVKFVLNKFVLTKDLVHYENTKWDSLHIKVFPEKEIQLVKFQLELLKNFGWQKILICQQM